MSLSTTLAAGAGIVLFVSYSFRFIVISSHKVLAKASGIAERQKVYSDCRMKRVFRSSMTRLYVRFILSFKKEWSMSAYVFCGISINISSTEAARFLGNPILFANYLMDSYFFSRFKSTTFYLFSIKNHQRGYFIFPILCSEGTEKE